MSRSEGAPQPLQRQLERGALFTHTALGEGYERVADVQALLHGLTDLLLTNSVVAADELEPAMQPVRAELNARGEGLGPGLVIRHDGPDAPPAAEVDGAAHIANCQGVCLRCSCRHDERIWSDFDAMQLNTDWIEAHVTGGREPRALRAQMHWPPEANEAAP